MQLFLVLGNERVNSFWAANVPPSEALTLSSCSEDRRRFITNKYRQGKYRRYHPLYGNQTELNNVSSSVLMICLVVCVILIFGFELTNSVFCDLEIECTKLK